MRVKGGQLPRACNTRGHLALVRQRRRRLSTSGAVPAGCPRRSLRLALALAFAALRCNHRAPTVGRTTGHVQRRDTPVGLAVLASIRWVALVSRVRGT
jgi:hypothetical protein